MITNALLSICAFIDKIIYSFISFLYEVFILISKANLFTETTLRTITDRIFTILGVAMLFYIAYEVLMLIVEPEKLTGENGAKKIVTKFITSLVIIILLPTIFRWAQILQTNVIEANVIGNIILGSSSGEISDEAVASDGAVMSLSIAQAFLHPEEDGVEYSYLDCKAAGDNAPYTCSEFVLAYEEALRSRSPWYFFDNVRLNKMKYYPIMSTIAAILALRLIVVFCIDIGIRVAKLGFLQLVAPIPIAQNITSSESLTQTKWFKSITSTYLEIFMKLIVIFFAMFAVKLVPSVISNIWPAGDQNFFIKMLATVAVVLGILQFAKDAPQLIKDLFDIELDINIKKRLEENTYAQRGVAYAGGMGAAGASNFYNEWKTRGTKDEDGHTIGGLRAFSRGITSSIGGVGGAARRGIKHSKDVQSWGEVGSTIDRTRTETDRARTARDARQELALERGSQTEVGKLMTDMQGNQYNALVKGIGNLNLKLEEITDIKDRAVFWLGGEISTEKLEAAQSAKSAIDTVFNRYVNNDVRQILEARDKALQNLHTGEEVRGIRTVNATGAIDESSTLINSNNVTEDDIKKYYKALELNSLHHNYTKPENIRTFTRAGDDLVKVLSEKLNTLGEEATKEFLNIHSTGFNSLGEIKAAFEAVGEKKATFEQVKNLNKLSGVMQGQINSQEQIYRETQRKKEEK